MADKWKTIQNFALRQLVSKRLDSRYEERLFFEFNEIRKQGSEDYWIDLIQQRNKFQHNPHGLVLPYLIGITNIDPIVSNIDHVVEYQPDFPDIDMDFLPIARDPIKTYAAEKYGEEHVCSIGSWQTYKPKSALQDAARVYGEDFHEVIVITKEFPDDFDDMDMEKAISSFPTFKEYFEKHPKIVEMAYRMVGLIKTQGKHAGGLLVSSVPIRDHVPLTYSNGYWISAWTEGRHTQLSKLGFIKFDILGLSSLMYIWTCCNHIRENRGIIIDFEDMDREDNRIGWVTYQDGQRKKIRFDDEGAIDLANQVKTDSIFQFDTPLAKKIIADGGVKSFDDLVVYSALGRPGPLPMVSTYIKRRDGYDDWSDGEHPEIVKILKETFGIIVYQEQLADIWRKLAGFTAPEAEAARKAVAKKWTEKLQPIKQKWVTGASKTLGKYDAEIWWEKMETFGRYAFNRCLDKDTLLTDAITGVTNTVEQWYETDHRCLSLPSMIDGSIGVDEVIDIYDNGEQEVYEVEFEDGTFEHVTLNHRFLCEDGEYHELWEIIDKGLEVTSSKVNQHQ